MFLSLLRVNLRRTKIRHTKRMPDFSYGTVQQSFVALLFGSITINSIFMHILSTIVDKCGILINKDAVNIFLYPDHTIDSELYTLLNRSRKTAENREVFGRNRFNLKVRYP